MAGYDGEGTSDTDAHRGDVVAALNDFEAALSARYEYDLTHGKVVQGAKNLTMQYLSATPNEEEGDLVKEWVNRDETPGWSKRNASEVRADIERAVPWYDTQNLKILEVAFDNMVAAAESLGWTEGGLTSYAPGSIAKLADDINSDGGTVGGNGEWTGPTSIAFKPFGQSAPKTATHHRNIAASMTQLYAGRICIIDTVRLNTVETVKAATNGLKATEDYAGTAGEWLAFNLAAVAVGVAVGAVGGPVGAAGGIAVGAAAAVQSFRVTEDPIQVPANSIGGVITGLQGQLRNVTKSTQDAEYDWAEKVQQLAREITQVKRSELELHDFTKGDGGATGPSAGTGFSVDTTYVTNLSGKCVKASEKYEAVIGAILLTDSADAELNGLNGQATWGDRQLIDIRDTFVSFTKVTCARFHEAGTRLYETALLYDRVDEDAAGALMYEKFSDDPDLNGGGTGKGGSTDDDLDGTDTGAIEDRNELGDGPRSPQQGR